MCVLSVATVSRRGKDVSCGADSRKVSVFNINRFNNAVYSLLVHVGGLRTMTTDTMFNTEFGEASHASLDLIDFFDRCVRQYLSNARRLPNTSGTRNRLPY